MDRPRSPDEHEGLRQFLNDEIERGNEEHRKARAQAFVSDLVVKERDTIQPTFYVRGELPADFSGATREPPSDERGCCALTPVVGAEGVEPSLGTV
jgi:hypothetical protein